MEPLDHWTSVTNAVNLNDVRNVNCRSAGVNPEQMHAERVNGYDPLPVIDGLLAASAKIRGWTLVTRNTADLARSTVMLLNPFARPART